MHGGVGNGGDDCKIAIILLTVKGHMQCKPFICWLSKKGRPLTSGFNQRVVQEDPHLAGLTKPVGEERLSFRTGAVASPGFPTIISVSSKPSALPLVGMQKILVKVSFSKKTI